MDEGLRLLEGQLKDKKKRVFSPWFYDVASGRFERPPADNSTAINAGGFPQFHYLPSGKQFFAVGSDTVAVFDPPKDQWTDARPKGPSPKGYDACGCYDSKRNRIYRNDGDGSKGEGLMAYDIGGNAWSHLKPTGNAPPPANTNAAFYEYDARLDAVVAIHFAVVSTQHFIRHGELDDTLAVSELLLGDTEDLIHKATGWTLREVGKKDQSALEAFLDRHAAIMPRTMLRYAIEKISPDRRRAYLQRKPKPSGGAADGV